MSKAKKPAAKPAASETRPWPADAVERRPIETLVPYARNARTHTPAQIDQIAASIKEWGWTTPVLIAEDSTIIAGHGRVLAAQKLGMAEIPVMIARGWTEAQKKAYVLVDNQLALNAGWDMDMLRIEIEELQNFEFDIGLLGFPDDMLAPLADLSTKEPEERTLKSVIQFNIVFDSESQQELWFGFVRMLKGKYPDEQTLGARLAQYLQELPG